MQTINISKTKSKETTAWFRSPSMPSGQEMDRFISWPDGTEGDLNHTAHRSQLTDNQSVY